MTGSLIDKDLGGTGFAYQPNPGQEGTVHVEQVLEYNEDPAYLKDLFLHKLTVEALNRVKASPVSRREIIRRLRTSAFQFSRLLDPTNHGISAGQLLSLLCALHVAASSFSAARFSSGKLRSTAAQTISRFTPKYS